MINNGRYSNPALEAMNHSALATMDDAARRELLAQATQVVADDVAVIPLLLLDNISAVRKKIVSQPRVDQRTPAFEMRQAP